MSASLFDLVEHQGKNYTVCGVDSAGKVKLIERSWPVEFGELEDFAAPSAIDAPASSVRVLESGRDRLLKIADMLIESDERAEARGGTDWSDVDSILVAAAEALPSNLLVIDLEKSSWKLSEDVPDGLLLLVNPAAVVIATHAIGAGDANISDIEDAVSYARRAVAQYRGDAPAAAPTP